MEIESYPAGGTNAFGLRGWALPGTEEFDLGEESLPRAHPIAYFEERSGRFHLPVHFGIRVTTDDETLELLPQLGDGYEVEAILEATGCRLTLISRRTTTQSPGF